MLWFPKYTKPAFLKPSTAWRAVPHLWSNGKESKFVKSITGIPEVSTLPLNTVVSNREATDGWNKVLEKAALTQDNIVLESVVKLLQRSASSALVVV